MFGRATNLLIRNTIGNFVRNHSHGGIPGENLPFSIQNRHKFTALFFLFFTSGIAAPFVIVRHQLLKK